MYILSMKGENTIMNILIIDDEAFMRKSIKRKVANIFPDHNVFEAASTDEALIMMEFDTIDIVFIDITMPSMNGLTFIKKYGYRFPDTKWVVMLTTDEYSHSQIREAMRLKVTYCILKPCVPSDIKETFDKLLSPGKS